MKIIEVLNLVNKKTNNMFYTFLFFLTNIVVSALLFFNEANILLITVQDALFLGFFLHTLLTLLIGFLTLAVMMVVYHFSLALINVFEESIREVYGVKTKQTKSKSTVSFN